MWESSELPCLFECWAAGASRDGERPISPIHTPGFAFEPGASDEAEHAAGLLALAIAFGCGLTLNDAARGLSFDHDGSIRASAPDSGIGGLRALFRPADAPT